MNSNNPPINDSVQYDATESSNNVTKNQSNATAKLQCKGMAEVGGRCKCSAGSREFCYQHGGQ